MLLALAGPIGNHGKQMRSLASPGAENFGKPQVIANEWANEEAEPVEKIDAVAGGIMLIFPAEGERMQFRVAQDRLSLDVNHHRLVAAFAVGPKGHFARHDINTVKSRDGAEELLGLRRHILFDFRDIHAEAAGEHFGQNK